MITLSIDSTQATKAFVELHDALLAKGMDASNLVRDQAILTCRTMAKATPPLGSGAHWSMRGDAEMAGAQAIETELSRVFYGMSDATISEAEACSISGIVSEKLWSTKDGRVYGVEKTRLLQGYDYAEMAKWHNAARQRSTGKVAKINPVNVGGQADAIGRWRFVDRVVASKAAVRKYIDEVKSHLGRWKATWAISAFYLGDEYSYPDWIFRQKNFIEKIRMLDASKIDNGARSFVVFGTRAPGAGRSGYAQTAQAVVRARARSMRIRARLILKDYSNWRTVRARANARKGKVSPE